MRSPMSKRATRRLPAALLVLILAAALGAAGCGSSSSSSSGAGSGGSSSSSSSSSSSGDPSGVATAQAFAKQSMQLPTSMDLPTTTKPIPTGKTVTFVHCGVEVCSTIVDAIKSATSILGWNLKVVPSDGSPTGVKAAWDSVVRISPDAAFSSGFSKALFSSELQQLNSKNIPVFSWSTTDTAGDGIKLVKGGTQEVGVVGKEMAAWAVSSTNGKANTLYVDLPSYVILAPISRVFDQYYKQWCPSCSVAHISVPITSIGSTAPTTIVAYLRAHPDVNRVALSYDGIGAGLPAALKAAGLNTKVQFIGEAPTSTNLSYVQTGQEAATVSQGYYEIWAMFVDAAARELTGQSLTPDENWHVPWFLVTKDNIAAAGGSTAKPLVPNLNGELAKIWGKQ
jgi:ribose transport system substrate-binding protein